MANVKCTHCSLEFDENIMIKEDNHFFCCTGCQGVFHLLNSEGLESFYSKKGDTKLDSNNKQLEDSSKFDLESFQKKYIKTTKSGFSSINLIIEGIHCSACVWLNEKVLYQTEGIVEANINFTTHKATIVYDEEIVKLSQIIETIRNIGYNAYPYDVTQKELTTNSTKKDYYIRLIIAVFGSMNIMTLAIAKYGGWFTGMEDDIELILKVAEFIIATPVLFYSGWIYFKGAYYAIKNRFVNMDFLVASGALLTYIYSIYAIFTPNAQTYFDSVVMIITFISVGKFMEVLSKKAIVDKLDTLHSQIPDNIMVIRNEEKISIPSIDVKIDDIIEVKGGEKIVVDGIIISGEGSLDESSLSGESLPILKKVGDKITSGTIIVDTTLRYKATKLYEDSTLAKLIELTNESMNKKPQIEKISNEISGWFSLVILAIALMTFIGWYQIDGEFEKAFIIGISVIVIACPCALALATPIASLVGIEKATENRLIFKEARHLETMSKANVLVLDKTGTLTQGKPTVTSFNILEKFDINLLYSLVKHSTHPVSMGVINYIKNIHHDLQELELDNIKLIEAKGIRATYNGVELIGGNIKFLKENKIDISGVVEDTTLFLFAINKKLYLNVYLEDQLKDGAFEFVTQIKSMGIQTIMLSGDNKTISEKIAKELKLDSVHSQLTPLQKADYITNLKQDDNIVVMVGDGINDSLALSRSDIAIAMGSGADISVEVSDVIVLDNSLISLKNGFMISNRTFSNIKQNLFISLIYNLITIPLAVMGYVIPMIAALSMSLSSLLVVANSFRIKLKSI